MKAFLNPVNPFILIIMVLTNCVSDGDLIEMPKPIDGVLISSSSEEISSSSVEQSSSSDEETSSSSEESSSSSEESSSSSEEEFSSSSENLSSFELSSSSSKSLKECEDTFNPNNRFCYDGETYDKCDGMEYNPTTQICQGDVAVIARCGGTQYNPLERGCCVSAIFSLANQRCQSNVVETKCVTGNIYHNPATEQCCVDSKYTVATEFCQGGTTVKPLCGTATYTSSQFCQAGTNVVKDLCGIQTYTASQFCCNAEIGTTSTEFCQDTMIKPLCGTATYAANQRCGANNVIEMAHCGGEEYAITEQCCVDSKYAVATEFCQGTTIKPLCGTATYTSSQFCQAGTNAVKDLCGTATYISSQFCSANTVYSKCGSTLEYNPATEQCCGNGKYTTATEFCQSGTTVLPLCGGEEYAGMEYCSNGTKKTYKTIVIGEQTWMAENLNYEAEGSTCYNNLESNCDTYGRLYDWATAMVLDASCNSTSCSNQIQTKHRGICPEGWHIPSQAEWNILSSFVGGSSTEGKHLKSQEGWNNCGPSGSGKNYSCEDTYGFAALPGGQALGGGFLMVGLNGYWWSASEHNDSDYGGLAYYKYMSYLYEYANLSNNLKSYVYSVRCLQD